MAEIDWTRLPPLSALRAFEATARLQSFSAAARSLNVTHAAVAQQVRALEAHLGLVLVQRQARGMAVTAEGAQLAAALGEGFAAIEAGVRALERGRDGAPLKIALTPPFAETWLMPRLGDFWARNPGAELALVPSAALVDLRAEGYDLAIRYGAGPWPGLEAEPLTGGRFVVVGAPGLLGAARPEGAGALSAFPWITAQDSPEQRLWAEGLGLNWEALAPRLYPTTSLALAATRAGYGLSVQTHVLVDDDLRKGRLVALAQRNSEGLCYHLVTRPGVQPPALRRFLGWLRQQAKEG